MKKIVCESLNEFKHYSNINHNTNIVLDDFFNSKIKNFQKLEESLYLDLYDQLNNAGVMNEGVNVKDLLKGGEETVMKWLSGIKNSMTNNTAKLKKSGGAMLKKIKGIITKVVSKFPKIKPKAFALLVLMTFTVINSSIAKGSTPTQDSQKNQTEQGYDGDPNGGDDISYDDAVIQSIKSSIEIAIGVLESEPVAGLDAKSAGDIIKALTKMYKGVGTGEPTVSEGMASYLLDIAEQIESSLTKDSAQSMKAKGLHNLKSPSSTADNADNDSNNSSGSSNSVKSLGDDTFKSSSKSQDMNTAVDKAVIAAKSAFVNQNGGNVNVDTVSTVSMDKDVQQNADGSYTAVVTIKLASK